jgi:predicted amidohydrolase YtcJ
MKCAVAARSFLVALATLACGACAGSAPRSTIAPAADRPADLLLENVHVFGASGTSLAIRDGVFVDAHVARETRDLKGAWVLPGLRDAHVHLAAYGDVLLGRVCDLVPSTSEADALRRVRAFIAAQKLGPTDWVVCQGWNEARWSEKTLPSSTAALDEAVEGRPAILSRQDGHTAWVSKRALAIGGVTRETSVGGGEVMKDASGEPSGVLTDNALAFVRRHEPPPTDVQIEAAILRALDECARFGLVEVHDALVHPRVDKILRKLANEDRLRMRVSAMIWLPTPKILEQYMAANAPVTRPIHGRYVVRTVKLFADGVFGGASAKMLAPYANRPTWSGVSRTSRE